MSEMQTPWNIPCLMLTLSDILGVTFWYTVKLDPRKRVISEKHEKIWGYLCHWWISCAGVQVRLRTHITPWQSVKIQKMFVLVGGFLLHPNTMCLYFHHSQTFQQLIDRKCWSWRWSWEKIFDLQWHGQVVTIFQWQLFNIAG